MHDKKSSLEIIYEDFLFLFLFLLHLHYDFYVYCTLSKGAMILVFLFGYSYEVLLSYFINFSIFYSCSLFVLSLFCSC